VLGVKTPLAFLALLGIGAVTCVKNWRGSPARPGRAWWLPLAFSLGIFLFSLTSHVDTGVRHILPIYMGFSIMAAVGAARLLDLAQVSKWAGLTLGALLLWLAASSALAHPDYIPYFNALAGGHPENIVVDSDLDWGQDMKRLSKRLHEAGATTLSFAPFLNDNGMPGFPQFRDNDPMAPDPGWNAVSLSQLKINRLGFGDDHPEIQPWPERVPPGELVGKTILLWYFPPKQ